MKLSMDARAMKVVGCLVIMGLLLFGASFNDPFHFDDVLILNDSNVTNPSQWHHFLNPLHLRQLTFFTFYLNYTLGGDSPSLYHVVNVAVHIANAVLLFWLVLRFQQMSASNRTDFLGQDQLQNSLETESRDQLWLAAAVAGVFLIHPVQTEPVLYIYQRSVLLACFFSLSAFHALLDRRWYLASALFFFAFESKESAVAALLVLALIAGGRLRKPFLVAAALLSVAALGVLLYQNETTVGLGAVKQISSTDYFWAQTRVAYTYMRLLVFPYPQSLEYEFPQRSSLLPLLGLIAIGGGGWLLSRLQSWRIQGLAVLSFFLLLAPTSSVIPSADPAFEHRLYLPMLAFSVFIGTLFAKLPHRTTVSVLVACVLMLVTVNRENVWASDIALWEDASVHAPGKARVWTNLGGAYLTVDVSKSREAFLRALEIEPNFTEALYNLGAIEQGRSNWSAAISFYERTIMTKADYWPAWNNLGNVLFAIDQRDRALDCFERTLSLNRDYWPAQYNIAVVHYMASRYDKVIPRLKVVLDWRPDFQDARRLLATSLTQAGFRSAAEEQWRTLGEIAAAESRQTPTMILAPTRP